MTRALIADDEDAPRAQLRAAIAQAWPELNIVAEATNGVDAWDAYLEHEPQVCFLDIRMPGLSGIDVARRIGGHTPVVFVTAYGDHALAAFDAGAVDYLLKPVQLDRVAQTIARLKPHLAKQTAPQNTAQWQALMNHIAATTGGQRPRSAAQVLQASVGKEVRLIRVEDVVFFESDSRYTRVVHADGEALIRTPLKELLAQLDDAIFWQVHRSVIVNHRHIASAVRDDDGGMQLQLRARAERLPVSRHFQGLFKGQ